LEKLDGAGWVWSDQAEDTKLDRFVVLKFLPEEVAKDRQALKPFKREACASDGHSNTCDMIFIGILGFAESIPEASFTC
jgi:hypothetical protein